MANGEGDPAATILHFATHLARPNASGYLAHDAETLKLQTALKQGTVYQRAGDASEQASRKIEPHAESGCVL